MSRIGDKLKKIAAASAAMAPIVAGEDHASFELAPMIRFDPSQARVFRDEARVIAVIWHRQKGKDFVASAKAVDHCFRTGQDWFIVSLTQRQADATFAKCKQHAEAFKQVFKWQGEIEASEWSFIDYDAEIDEAFKSTARVLTLPSGGRVVSLPGRDPDTLAGLTGNVIFTEFALFPKGGYEHWRVVFPLSTRGYQVIVISTPRAKNHKFFEIFSDPETYSVHFCDIYKSIADDGFVLRDNKHQPTDLETFKKLYGDPIGFDREYGCQFVGEMQPLIQWAQLIDAANQGKGLPFSLMTIDGDAGYDPSFFQQPLPGGGRLEMGWDVARTGHYAALWCNHRRPGHKPYLRFLVLMRRTSFELQRQIVRDAMDAGGWGSGVGCGDATGLGMDSNETLVRIYGARWEAVNFSSKKSELGSRALAAYRDGEQAIPPLEGETKFIGADIYAVQRISGTGAGDDGTDRSDEPKEAKLKLSESQNPLLPDSHCDIAYANFLSLRAGGIKVHDPVPDPLPAVPVEWGL